MMRIAKRSDGKIIIDTPYNPSFVQRIKAMGGKWDAQGRTWITDERNIEAVRGVMREIYGRDDSPAADLVSVRVAVSGTIYAGRGPVVLFGRTIASATGRDSGARVGDGVAFTQGAPRSGGSMKNWATEIRPGAVILIHDVPRQAVEAELNWADSYGTYEIIASAPNRRALEEERARLQARLAEIEQILATI